VDPHWYASPSDFWGRLSPDVQARLSDLGPVVQYGKHDMIFRAGSDGDEVFVLMCGRIKVYTLSPAGRAVTLWICLPGEVFGLAEMARQGPRAVYAEACVPSEVLSIPCNRLRSHLSDDPSTAMLIIDMLSCRVRQLTDALLNITSDDVNTRTAKLLWRLHMRHGVPVGDGSSLIDLQLTHQEIAEMIGATRQSVSGAVTHFRNLGLIHARGRRMILIHPERFRAIFEPVNHPGGSEPETVFSPGTGVAVGGR